MDIIVDIDGTLANIEHRLHFIRKPEPPPIATATAGDYERWYAWKPNWDAFFSACVNDDRIEEVMSMVGALQADGNRLVFATGRPERVRAVTVVWLWQAGIGGFNPVLYMRKDGDHRPDHVVKRELLAKMRADGFDPKLAIDDRQQVVDMWRAEGLICAQVAKGDF